MEVPLPLASGDVARRRHLMYLRAAEHAQGTCRARLQAVQAIEQGDLEPDKLGSVSLADYGRHLSVDGTANVRSDESGNLIVTFWVFRGPLVIPYTAVIYTSKGVPLTNADLFPEEILEQYALDPNWYFVTAK